MSTVDRPYHIPGFKVTLTTFGGVSKSTAHLKCSFGGSTERKLYGNLSKSPCDKICYELPSTKSPRAAGFGIGNRFYKPPTQNISPDPASYV